MNLFMSDHIQAIYENGILRPLQPLDLPENSVVEIDVRDVKENDTNKEQWLKEFDEWMGSLDPNTPNLTDEQIRRESIYEEPMNRQCESDLTLD
jgi:predicted DNA-binding antitoxin AbrB/MazE fold protein